MRSTAFTTIIQPVNDVDKTFFEQIGRNWR